MKYNTKYLKKVLSNHGYNPRQFEQKWYEFALLLIIAENTEQKNNLTIDDLNTNGSQS
ncbi:MAG: hypothetical protein ACTSWD_16855 [Candidatus Heimdallarchaeota archaeon]|jgi:hypothetical protein